MSSQLVANLVGRMPVGGEFQGRNGDCAEAAFMYARCAGWPQYPCDGPELNRLTSEAIAAGEVDCPGGCMTDAQFAWLLNYERWIYTQETFTESVLLGAAGIVPICCGFRNGQALPGNEQGVFGHAIAILDLTPTGYTLANGDSVSGRQGLLDYDVPLATLLTAQPTTLTRLWGLQMLTIDQVPNDYEQLDETHWRCKRNGYLIQLGLLNDYRTYPTFGGLAGMTGLGYPLENEHGVPNLSGVAVQRFERGTRVYDPGRIADNPPGATGPVYAGHVDAPIKVIDTAAIIRNQTAIITAARDSIVKAGGTP